MSPLIHSESFGLFLLQRTNQRVLSAYEGFFRQITQLLFLHSGIPETLPRLTAMIRGIGDPLVAAYARAYLCRVRRAHFLQFSLLSPVFGDISYLAAHFHFVSLLTFALSVGR